MYGWLWVWVGAWVWYVYLSVCSHIQTYKYNSYIYICVCVIILEYHQELFRVAIGRRLLSQDFYGDLVAAFPELRLYCAGRSAVEVGM